jgi:hypothetical protein
MAARKAIRNPKTQQEKISTIASVGPKHPSPKRPQTERNLRTHHPFLDLNGRRDRQGHRKNTTDPKRQAEVDVRAQRLQHWRKDEADT